jgi:hypothetical protein
MSGCNKLRPVCTVDATDRVSRDSGEQSEGTKPGRVALLSPPRGQESGDMEKDAKDLPGSRGDLPDGYDVIMIGDGGIEYRHSIAANSEKRQWRNRPFTR